MDDPQVPALIWDWAKTTGPAGFALVVWWLERQERIATQRRNEVLVDKLTDAASEIKTFKDLLMTGRK